MALGQERSFILVGFAGHAVAVEVPANQRDMVTLLDTLAGGNISETACLL